MPSASDRDKLFADLGLLDESEEAPNPYNVLGLDQAGVQEYLREDTSGELVRVVSKGIYRALSQRYHPDNTATGNSDRFREITDARDHIDEATPDQLQRWARTERRPVSTARINKVRTEQEAIASRAAELVRLNMELGQHPQHFSQLEWSQGILLKHNASTLLARRGPNGGLGVVPGRPLGYEATGQAIDVRKQVVDFGKFLRERASFGLEPGSQIVMFIDETNRASILAPDLSFTMDITDAVKKYHRLQAKASKEDQMKKAGADYWSRASESILLVTRVPDPKGLEQMDPKSQFLVFPDWVGAAKKRGNVLWSLPMEVAGTIGSIDTFRRLRHARTVGAAALESSGGRMSARLFGTAAITARQLVEQGIDYSPLITPGTALLLYSGNHNIPVVTDAEVVGMIGNNAHAF